MQRTILIASLVASACVPTLAEDPKMGGPMKHMQVSFDGKALSVSIDPNVPTPELQDYGETYEGAAGVLDGTFYNAQYGWLVEGFWTPPSNSLLWIEETFATKGLEAYSGGNMNTPSSFAPIFGTNGSEMSVEWNGAMTHNWYAVEKRGNYVATYEIYFGDSAGVDTPGFDRQEVVLVWSAGSCLADCDGSGSLDVFDFVCFQSAFQGQEAIADCDANGQWDVFDFVCFQTAFGAGCE